MFFLLEGKTSETGLLSTQINTWPDRLCPSEQTHGTVLEELQIWKMGKKKCFRLVLCASEEESNIHILNWTWDQTEK
jgi:hypothetical protein